MSRALIAVRFPDGVIRWGIYLGATDSIAPALDEAPEAAWAGRGTAVTRYPEPVGPVEDVEVYSDYSDGSWWPGKATRNAVVSPLDCDGIWNVEQEGRPSWYREAFPDDDAEDR